MIIKDRTFHLVLLAVIFVLGATVLYFLSIYYSGDDSYRNSFLTSLSIFNPEFSYQLQQLKEEPVPNAVRVPIFIYHSVRPHALIETPLLRHYIVAPDSFSRELEYIKDNGYTVIGLDYLTDALVKKIILPPKSVILTFDDGWSNQYLFAFSLLKKYDFTATFFVFTNAIGHNGFLTWDQLKQMDDDGMDIGAHTESHPYLAQIGDPAILENEIAGSKKVIEDHLGRPIDLFAYPFGYYDDQIINIVKEAGFKSARSTRYGAYNTADDIYKLKAIEATDDFNQFVADLKG